VTVDARQSIEPAVEVLPAGTGQSDAVVIPGVPGVHLPPDAPDTYPSLTIDLIKILRGAGLTIDYAEPDSEKAWAELLGAEVWVPIIVFAQQAIAAGVGGVLTAAVLELVGKVRASRSKLHVKIGRLISRNETVAWLEATGTVDDVLKAVKTFLEASDE